MLSRPFYQPFNIICSRIRSLARAAQIASVSGPYEGGAFNSLFDADGITRIARDFYCAAYCLRSRSKESKFLAKIDVTFCDDSYFSPLHENCVENKYINVTSGPLLKYLGPR